tara:strand:+ start:220 stop:594 length:375 start_codon:yes stop_codon:yes gene_type:complete
MKKYVTLIMIFIASLCGAQDMLTTDTFKKEISRGIVVVEFWAGWNSSNECEWLSKLKECEMYRVDIGIYMDIQQKYNITAIPTLIVFNNGNVEEQFDPNIMFQLEATKNDVQGTIDEIMLKQFE